MRAVVSVLICEREGRMQVGMRAKGQRKEWAVFDRWQAAGLAGDFANYMKIQLLSDPQRIRPFFPGPPGRAEVLDYDIEHPEMELWG